MEFLFLSELINFGEVENSERLLGEPMSRLCATRREQPSYCFQLDQNWWSLREKMCNLWWNLWEILNVQFPLHKVENSCFKSNFLTFSQLYNPKWSKKHNYKYSFQQHDSITAVISCFVPITWGLDPCKSLHLYRIWI